jgi:hypothetical protein
MPKDNLCQMVIRIHTYTPRESDMDLSECSGYFHDGTLVGFKHAGDSIIISMISAEVIPEHMIENMLPLKDKRIRGNLYLNGVRKISINQGVFYGELRKTHDSGSILDFEVSKHRVTLGIEWTDYPPKPRWSDFSTIEIEAEAIHWENA